MRGARRLRLAAVFVPLALVGCVADEPSIDEADLSHLTGSATPQTPETSALSQATVNDVVDDVSGTSFALAGTVTEQAAELPGVHRVLTGRTWSASDGDVTGVVSVFDLGGRTFADNVSIDGAAQVLQATAANRVPIEIDGHEGMVADLTRPSGEVTRLATAIAGDHVYQVSATDANGSFDAADAALQGILESVDIP